MSATQLRPSRRRSVKIRRTYREPDSGSDLDFEFVTTNPRPTRSSRRIQTYREPNTTDEESDAFSSSLPDLEPASRPLQRTSVAQRRTQRGVRRSQRNKQQVTNQHALRPSIGLNSFKRQKVTHAGRVENKALKEPHDYVADMPTNLKAPPWQTLEYHNLLKIMQYAAYPLYTSAHRASSSVEWLIGVSRLCKSFHDAATAALLWEPPLIPNYRAHGLISMLSQPQEELMTNYRTKIRSLNVEVNHLLVKKSGINIEDILKHTPLLSHLRLFHWYDEMVGKAIWAEPSMSHFKWWYGSVFDVMNDYTIRLQSFEWNGRFQDTVSKISDAHRNSCMRNLREVSFVNFTFAEKQEEDRIRTREAIINSLTILKNLEKLEFRNCTIVDTTALTQVPLGLKSLKIINCLSLTSEAIESYLVLGGNNLLHLHLEGNQVMALGFVPKLSSLCPVLETLFIDLSYEDCSSYRDRNPLYDELLPNGGPTWPTTLVSIIVGPLRALEITDAEDFYSSLLHAANNLPYLRVISIKTLLNNASWRDRASLRKRWRPLFEKVFAANWTQTPSNVIAKSKKRKRLNRKSSKTQEIDESSISEDMDEIDNLLGGLPLPRQNRCEVVEFELSDQRPAQEQYREDDFLDSEISGDDEWNGRDEELADSANEW